MGERGGVSVSAELRRLGRLPLDRGTNAFRHAMRIGGFEAEVIPPDAQFKRLERLYYNDAARSVFQGTFTDGRRVISVTENNVLTTIYLKYPGGGVLKIDAITGDRTPFLTVAKQRGISSAAREDIVESLDFGDPDFIQPYAA